MESLLGEKVKGKEGEVNVSSFEKEGGVVGLYFSAHWCPPCRGFTPVLKKWYEGIKAGPNKDKFEMVFLSSDRDEKKFDEYYDEMPWLAVPYANREKKAELSKKFKVSGIPTLIFLDASKGTVITSNGRAVVTDDPEGEEFPWKPKPLAELMAGKFKKGEEETDWESLKGKVLGIYFSGHWCGPCRAFTPQLITTYKTLKEQGKNFEIIFVSSDRDESGFKEYFAEMPWVALPFKDKRCKTLNTTFDLQGIPTFVLVDENCNTITTNGRAAVTMDPDGKDFPWYPKPVNKLCSATAGDLNDNPHLVCFTGGKTENMDQARTVLEPIAKKYIEECKTKGTEQVVYFCYAGMGSGGKDDEDDDDDLVASLRGFAKLPDKVPLVFLIDIPGQQVFLDDKDGGPNLPDDASMAAECKRLLEGYLDKSVKGRAIRA